MNLGAAIGVAQDRYARHKFFQALQQPEIGFRTDKDGSVWLWRFRRVSPRLLRAHASPHAAAPAAVARSLNQLHSDMDAPSGTAVALASLMGVPFVRLRAAFPDELLGWDMGTALGRRYVLSKDGMESMLDAKCKRPSLPGVSRLQSLEANAASSEAEPEAGADSDEQDVLMEEARPAPPPRG
jgi:hypothetical protein